MHRGIREGKHIVPGSVELVWGGPGKCRTNDFCPLSKWIAASEEANRAEDPAGQCLGCSNSLTHYSGWVTHPENLAIYNPWEWYGPNSQHHPHIPVSIKNEALWRSKEPRPIDHGPLVAGMQRLTTGAGPLTSMTASVAPSNLGTSYQLSGISYRQQPLPAGSHSRRGSQPSSQGSISSRAGSREPSPPANVGQNSPQPSGALASAQRARSLSLRSWSSRGSSFHYAEDDEDLLRSPSAHTPEFLKGGDVGRTHEAYSSGQQTAGPSTDAKSFEVLLAEVVNTPVYQKYLADLDKKTPGDGPLTEAEETVLQNIISMLPLFPSCLNCMRDYSMNCNGKSPCGTARCRESTACAPPQEKYIRRYPRRSIKIKGAGMIQQISQLLTPTKEQWKVIQDTDPQEIPLCNYCVRLTDKEAAECNRTRRTHCSRCLEKERSKNKLASRTECPPITLNSMQKCKGKTLAAFLKMQQQQAHRESGRLSPDRPSGMLDKQRDVEGERPAQQHQMTMTGSSHGSRTSSPTVQPSMGGGHMQGPPARSGPSGARSGAVASSFSEIDAQGDSLRPATIRSAHHAEPPSPSSRPSTTPGQGKRAYVERSSSSSGGSRQGDPSNDKSRSKKQRKKTGGN